MIDLVYQGIDSLDVAIKGAASSEVLKILESARNKAEANPYNQHGIRLMLGQDKRPFVIKEHGKKGGYRYTAVDEKTGSIFSIKHTVIMLFLESRTTSSSSSSHPRMDSSTRT